MWLLYASTLVFFLLTTNIDSCSTHNCLYMYSGDFDDDSDGFDRGFYPLSDCNSGDEDFRDQTLHVPKQRLRSRPPIDFTGRPSGQPSTIGHPPSHMSGSTLHTMLNPPNFPRKASSHLGSSSCLSPEAIECLTESELFLNPLHCKLRQKYDHLSGVLAMYLERELAESRVAKSDTLVLDIQQGE
jgi:hypothetical protein